MIRVCASAMRLIARALEINVATSDPADRLVTTLSWPLALLVSLVVWVCGLRCSTPWTVLVREIMTIPLLFLDQGFSSLFNGLISKAPGLQFAEVVFALL